MRPPVTVGWAEGELALGNPNAHFSVRRGTSAAARPASSADWNREFPRSLPHPFHIGPCSGLPIGVLGQRFVSVTTSVEGAEARDRPARNSASTCRWSVLSGSALTAIEPVVIASRITSGVRCRRASRSGARFSAAVSSPWQLAQ